MNVPDLRQVRATWSKNLNGTTTTAADVVDRRCLILKMTLSFLNLFPTNNNDAADGGDTLALAANQAEHSEIRAFTHYINNCLADDPDVSHLVPIALPTYKDDTYLFTALNDGTILCKLLEKCSNTSSVELTTILKSVNYNRNLSIYQKTENQNIAIKAASILGCRIVNIGAPDLISGARNLCLGLLWQIMKIHLFTPVSTKAKTYYYNDNSRGGISEDLLVSFVNYYNSKDRISNFSTDIADSTVYHSLLCNLTESNKSLVKCNATAVINLARTKLGIETFIQPSDILSGNQKLNMAFVAQIYNKVTEINKKQSDDHYSMNTPEHQNTQNNCCLLLSSDVDGILYY